MSIITKQPAMVKREYSIEEPVALVVERYAVFIQSTPDYVVNSALTKVLFRDAEFKRWNKQQQGAKGEGAAKSTTQQGGRRDPENP
jgi:hypothetical protein